MTVMIESDIYRAEDQLSRGLLIDARSSALSSVKAAQDRQLLGRGYSVIIQSDFQCNRLTDLEDVLQQCSHNIYQLPVATILLWGVVAVELGEADAARATLSKYLQHCSNDTGMTREDAMALSRLYAVQLLGNMCEDFAAAATWLEDGGVGLSHEQQELLLLELEEAEEVLQEERLAEWAATHAAAAADGQDSTSPTAAGAGAADPSAAMQPASSGSGLLPSDRLCSAGSKCSAVEGLLMSPATDAESVAMAMSDLGPSASAALSGGSFSAADRLGSGGSMFHPVSPAAATTASGLLPVAVSAVGVARTGDLTSQTEQQEQQEALVSSGAGSHAAYDTAGSQFVTVTGSLTADDEPSVSLRQAQQQQHLQLQDSQLQQLAVDVDDNAFCTMTGLLDDDDRGMGHASDPIAAAAGAAAAAGEFAAGEPVRASIADSSSSDSSRDQVDLGASKLAAESSKNTSSKVVADQVPLQQAQQVESIIQQPQQSLLDWMSSAASNAWQSQTVQGTLEALHLQGLEPWEVAGGAAVAVLLGYGIYRKRRIIRRGAADLAAGVAQTAQMALGMAINPMAAVPSTGHLR